MLVLFQLDVGLFTFGFLPIKLSFQQISVDLVWDSIQSWSSLLVELLWLQCMAPFALLLLFLGMIVNHRHHLSTLSGLPDTFTINLVPLLLVNSSNTASSSLLPFLAWSMLIKMTGWPSSCPNLGAHVSRMCVLHVRTHDMHYHWVYRLLKQWSFAGNFQVAATMLSSFKTSFLWPSPLSPCKGLVMWSLIILSVGQHSTRISPFLDLVGCVEKLDVQMPGSFSSTQPSILLE